MTPAATGRSSLVDDQHLTALDRAAVAVGELLVGVVEATVGDHRALGHAVPVADDDAGLASIRQYSSAGFGAPPPENRRRLGTGGMPGCCA